MKYTPPFRTALLSIVLLLISVGGYAEEENTQESILSGFHPYRQGPVQVEGITPGLRIDQSNAQVAQPVLPPEILTYLQAGDFTITVQAPRICPSGRPIFRPPLIMLARWNSARGSCRTMSRASRFP